MPAFKEIAKKFRKTVEIAGEKVSVRGLSGDELAGLILEFPLFEGLLGSGAIPSDWKAMIEQAPAGVAKFIAIGLAEYRQAPSPSDIEEIRSLPLMAQLEMLTPVAELSLPKRIVGPFVDLIREGPDEETSGRATDMESPSLPLH